MSAISTEVRAPTAVAIPDGSSVSVTVLPIGRFKLRIRDGLLAGSVGSAWLRVEGSTVHLTSRRPPRWTAVAAQLVPLGFVVSATLLVVTSLFLGLLTGVLTAIAMVVVALVQSGLARRESTMIHAVDAVVVTVRRPFGLGRVEGLVGMLERALPGPLSDVIGRRVVVVEASFGADRLAIRRRALVARRVATAKALVRALKAARARA